MDQQPQQVAPQKPRHLFLYAAIAFAVLVLGYFGIMVVQSLRSLTTNDPVEALVQAYATQVSNSSISGTGTSSQEVVSSDDPYFGSKDAKIKIVEFGDFQCPYCKQALESVKAIQQQFGDTIFFQFRDFPVVDSHAEAYNAALGAECAHEQGDEKFWQFHDRLYQFQDELSTEVITSIAQRIGLDVAKFNLCFSSKKYADEIQRDYNDGLAAGVTGTPTFFINGRRIPGAIPSDIFVKVIQKIQELDK
jgi:protein-disulfide isomerase